MASLGRAPPCEACPARSGEIWSCWTGVKKLSASHLGQQRHHVVPPGVGAVCALPEAAVQLAPDDPRLVGLVQLGGHGLTQDVDLTPHQWADVRVGRVLERRHEDTGVVIAHLVHVEIDLGQPVPIEDPVEMLRFHLRQHVAVAVVVMPGVRVIQLRQPGPLVRCPQVAAVPVDHHPLTIRVFRRDEQDDRVVEQMIDPRRLLRGQLIDEVVHQPGSCRSRLRVRSRQPAPRLSRFGR